MLNEITKSIVRETTTERPNEAYDGLVAAISLRSIQGIGIDAQRDVMKEQGSRHLVNISNLASRGYGRV